jgi:hypothetical protein
VAAAGLVFVPTCHLGSRVIGMKMLSLRYRLRIRFHVLRCRVAMLFYRCPDCPRSFPSSASLVRHRECEHSC